jgi:hypothetical protein
VSVAAAELFKPRTKGSDGKAQARKSVENLARAVRESVDPFLKPPGRQALNAELRAALKEDDLQQVLCVAEAWMMSAILWTDPEGEDVLAEADRIREAVANGAGAKEIRKLLNA